MNSYLQPNLLTTDELREHLRKRFPSQDLSQLPRPALLQLFAAYAVPKSRRGTCEAEMNDVEMKASTELSGRQDQNGNKRRRHTLITAPSVETVTNACKKIRLVNSNVILPNNSNRVTPNSQKRQCDSQMDCSMSDQMQQSSSEMKRKKITWP